MTDAAEFHPLSYQMKNTLVPIVLFVCIVIAGLSDLYKDFSPQLSLETPQMSLSPATKARVGPQTKSGIFK